MCNCCFRARAIAQWHTIVHFIFNGRCANHNHSKRLQVLLGLGVDDLWRAASFGDAMHMEVSGNTHHNVNYHDYI